ncbi:hypothetical protein LUZ60_010513 [Juncus effusus]|nr:hypothetical protein LUZ60_010513 [Juncus effusus]
MPTFSYQKPTSQKPPPGPVKPIMRRHVSPALYATPEPTPLPPVSPSSPSSFPPASPYLINHKRRGPRLLKSQSLDMNGGAQLAEKSLSRAQSQPVLPVSEKNNGEFEKVGGFDCEKDEMERRVNGFDCDKDEMERSVNGFDCEKDEMERINGFQGEKGEEGKEKEMERSEAKSVEREDFFEFNESMSATSEDGNNGIERPWKPSTPVGEFYDAFEEISSDGGSAFKVDQSNNNTTEEELREMRLSLLMEIEKRKQADEALETLKNQWLRLSQHLSLIGLDLPPLSEINNTNNNLNFEFDSIEELCQQIVVTRFVSEAICRGVSRAELAEEMDPVIQGKNFEISRLIDRVQYYEAANREMSLRNQETIEMARQQRNKRKIRQKWFWASIGLAVTLGSAAIAWSYLPASRSVQIDQKDASIEPS